MAQISVVMIGATGLVGSMLARTLCHRPEVGKVTALSRRPLIRFDHDKLDVRIIDFANIHDEAKDVAADVAISTLGTTQKQAGSREAFRKVDRDLVLSFADGAHRGGADHLLMVSAVGADPRSPSFYLKTKGEADHAVRTLGYERVDIFRPGLLLGDRDDNRTGEEIGKVLLPLVSPLMVGGFSRYKSIGADEVAHAMSAATVLGEPGLFNHQYTEMMDLIANDKLADQVSDKTAAE